MAMIHIQRAEYYIGPAYYVEVLVDNKLVAESPHYWTVRECRNWIAGVKKVTKFTKVEDKTGEP